MLKSKQISYLFAIMTMCVGRVSLAPGLDPQTNSLTPCLELRVGQLEASHQKQSEEIRALSEAFMALKAQHDATAARIEAKNNEQDLEIQRRDPQATTEDIFKNMIEMLEMCQNELLCNSNLITYNQLNPQSNPQLRQKLPKQKPGEYPQLSSFTDTANRMQLLINHSIKFKQIFSTQVFDLARLNARKIEGDTIIQAWRGVFTMCEKIFADLNGIYIRIISVTTLKEDFVLQNAVNGAQQIDLVELQIQRGSERDCERMLLTYFRAFLALLELNGMLTEDSPAR